MYAGNLKQWQDDKDYIPAALQPWIAMLASLDMASLQRGRHELEGLHYMNIDETETGPAKERLMEAHRQYIDIQYVIDGDEIIGWQPLCYAGPVVDDSHAGTDAWFYDPAQENDTAIIMKPGTFAIFTPADGHRCLCAPDGVARPIRKAIMKIHI
ncbi:MAG: YhcH/YjgK/YiaL family protein [Megasphaera sp.]|jgi:YhcH/YjgK/YiaL family protein|nr:YhcH/YjgK/YiaL family protein [Megasphaera sp.]MCH4187653.1 YhcH/YjgK/YiaL family protein [Megasphaera sp.]MCH4217151.1 YhcH/YjgK/YiaL family protein [Megasphaera sp.]